MSDIESFERDTTYRLLVEACRHWLLTWWFANKSLPVKPAVFWVYAGGDHGIGWGNPPGPDDPPNQPLRGKRIKVIIAVEGV